MPPPPSTFCKDLHWDIARVKHQNSNPSIIISLASIYLQDKSRVWMAASQQHMVENQPLATLRDFAFSHSEACIFENIPFSHKAVFWLWECWSEFLVAGCPPSHQPTRIMEETLESQTFDLGTQCHTHFFYDLAYLWLYECYWLGVDSNILDVEDLKKSKIGYLALMVGLGQTNLF